MPAKLPLLELVYDDPLFHMVCHPELPLIISGLGTGHIYCHKYNPEALQGILDENVNRYQKLDSRLKRKTAKLWYTFNIIEDAKRSIPVTEEDGAGTPVVLNWKTKRHKGSVRGLCMDSNGQYIYSIGSDNVLKKAETVTGRVVRKLAFPAGKEKFTKLYKSPRQDILLLGSEDGNVTVIDSNSLVLRNSILDIHSGNDPINDIFHFAKRSSYKYISLGQTTLAYWDIRESRDTFISIPGIREDDSNEEKQKVLLSDDQEDEILCGAFVDPEVGDILACGMAEGILTIWEPEKNDLEDQMSRIKVSKGYSIDCIIPTLQGDDCVWCGSSDGGIYRVNIRQGKVVEIRQHSAVEDAFLLELDFEYRVVSGGMDNVIVWSDTEDVVEKFYEAEREKELQAMQTKSLKSSDTNEHDSVGDRDRKRDQSEMAMSEDSDNEEYYNGSTKVAEEGHHNDKETSTKKKQMKVTREETYGIKKFEGL